MSVGWLCNDDFKTVYGYPVDASNDSTGSGSRKHSDMSDLDTHCVCFASTPSAGIKQC